MPAGDNEEELLRSVALQNAQSILQARQRAEDDLVRAKEELERKTEALARTVATIRATLESTADGILVTDGRGQVSDFNEKFLQLWGLTADNVRTSDHRQVAGLLARNFDEPARFLARVDEIHTGSISECTDLLELTDGRVFERVSRPQVMDGRNVGRVWSVRDITVRRRAEDALRKQSEWLRVTLASIGDAVITTDTTGRVTSLNPMAEVLTGWTHGDAYGILSGRVVNIVSAATREPVENPALIAMREGRIVGTASHTVLLASDGTERAIEDSAAPIKDERGNLLGAVLVFRDVTAQRRAEAARLHLATIVDSTADAIISRSLDGIVASWNEGAHHMFGYTAQEAVGKPITILLLPHQQHEELEILRRVRRGETLPPFEAVRVHKDGRLLDVSVTTSPICDAAGRVTGASTIARDITQRKRRDAIARFLADASAALVELGGDETALQAVSRLAVPEFADWCAVDLQDADGKIRRVAVDHAEAFVDLVGPFTPHPPTSISDRFGILNVLAAGQSHQGVAAPERPEIAHGETGETLTHLSPLGVRSHISVPLRSRGLAIGAITFVTTVSGRVYHVADLWAAEDLAHRVGIAFENANLLAVLRETDQRKDAFLATLAHELRNPLAPIRNAAEIIRVKSPPDPDLQWATEVIDRQVHQMTRLVDDLLDVSRITRGKFQLRRERVNLPEVMRTVLDASRPSIEKRGHTLAVTVTSQPFTLDADQTRLCQILLNLLDNAAKYTDRGGRIWLNVETDADHLVIQVRDTGIGIAPDMLLHIFEMFSQVDRSLERSDGGLGIGLMLVQQLVEMHGGTVCASSAGLGQGSEFVVRLPLATV